MRHRTQFRRFGALLAAGLLLFSLSAASAEKTVTLTFTGDCTLGGEERTRFQPDCFDTIVREQGYEYPFRYFRPLFEEDDCTVINMEGVLSDSYADEFKDKTFRFRGKTEFAEILTLASVEAAGLDNNHVNDYGAQGLRNTQETLANAGIAWFRALDIYILEKDGIRIKLTQVEYAIMKLFMQNPGRALSREDILASVWGRDYDGELKIVDVNIRRLRIKIEDDTANPTYITTVWGFGYKWGI